MNRQKFLIRPVQENDLISLCDIASKVGAGLPTLQNDRKILQEKIKRSLDSFAEKIAEQDRLFFFVLEDLEKKQIIGTSAIQAQVANQTPYYSYYVTPFIQKYHFTDRNEKIQIEQENKILFLSNDYQDSSLLCTLYVDPDNRSLGQGALLSRIRYLFMAEFPDFFAERVIAEMRGVYDENMQFPFWEGLGQHFYKMDIVQAEKLLAIEGTRIITELNPRLPIYLALLPLATQKAVGEVNPYTKPALHVLEKEGFIYQNHIDVFDGGPIVEARKKDIYSIKTSQVVNLSGTMDETTEKQKSNNENKKNEKNSAVAEKSLYIICNGRLNFRATVGRVEWQEKDSVFLEKSVIELLGLSIGDKLRLSAFR